MDVRIRQQIHEAVAAVAKEFGTIDILVNNAGINRPMAGLEVTEDNWGRAFQYECERRFFCCTGSGTINDGKIMGANYFYCEPVGIDRYSGPTGILRYQRPR